MIEILSDVATGGVLGLVGSVTTGVTSYFANRQQQKHELATLELNSRVELKNREFDLKQTQAEADARIGEAALAAEKEAYTESVGMVKASYQHDSTWHESDSQLLRVAEFVRKMTRPVLTLMLIVLVGIIYVTSDMTTQQDIAASVITLAATALSWWFADRMATGFRRAGPSGR